MHSMRIVYLAAIVCLVSSCGNAPVSNQPGTPAVQEAVAKTPPPAVNPPTAQPTAPPAATTEVAPNAGGPKPAPSVKTQAPASKPAALTFSLVGKWDVLNKLQSKTLTYEFRPDGTYILEDVTETPDNKGAITVITAGTYKQDGNKFSKHVVSKTEDTDDPPMKAAAEADTKNWAKQVNQIAEYTGTVHWKDADDAVIVANPGFDPLVEQEIQLKRHKG